MRTRYLVWVFLFVMLAVSLAAADDTNQVPAAPSNPTAYNLFQSPAAPVREFSLPKTETRNLAIVPPVTKRLVVRDMPETCYTMRTYMVKRQDATDVTQPAGYTTCLNSSKVEMKNAVVDSVSPGK